MPDPEDIYQEIRDTLVIHVQQVKDMLRRVEKNEENIRNLYERTGKQDIKIATTQQWVRDHERREAWLVGIATIVLTAMIWLSRLVSA